MIHRARTGTDDLIGAANAALEALRLKLADANAADLDAAGLYAIHAWAQILATAAAACRDRV